MKGRVYYVEKFFSSSLAVYTISSSLLFIVLSKVLNFLSNLESIEQSFKLNYFAFFFWVCEISLTIIVKCHYVCGNCFSSVFGKKKTLDQSVKTLRVTKLHDNQ